MTTTNNRQVILAKRPEGQIDESSFELINSPIPVIKDNKILIRNEYLSMDAGFRQWMNEGTGDNYLQAMELDAPVMSITLGEIIESSHPDYETGDLVMGRHAWEEYSLTDGSDFLTKLSRDIPYPIYYYLGILGTSGLTAYFGLTEVGKPESGEIFVISAAAGGVGYAAGQMAKAYGCYTVGITGSDDKCQWLEDEFGFDKTINYKSREISDALNEICPEGIDIYFDNVGGKILDAVMANLKLEARIVLCGAIARYNSTESVPGPYNMFELITKRASMKGFMFTDYVEKYPEAITQISKWLDDGKVKSADQIYEGIEQTPTAFCDLFRGENKGKSLVNLN